MSAGDVAAVAVTVGAAVVAVGVPFALAGLSRTLRTVRTAVEDVHRQAVPLMADLRDTVERANADLARVDGLLGRAESIGGTVDSASRLAYLAFSNPLIKLMALGSGTSRAARRLRRQRDRA